MTFTPGPWVIYPVSVNSYSCDIVRADDTNDRVAVTCPNGEVELHNARLIAAAPEIYEALQNLVDDCLILAEGLNDYPPCTQPSVPRNEASRKLKQYAADCLSALAKARGEA